MFYKYFKLMFEPEVLIIKSNIKSKLSNIWEDCK
jgi:hypothetical protein